MGGNTTNWALNRLDALILVEESVIKIDLVIVDYDINDCATLQDDDHARHMFTANTELLVRRLLMHQSEPAVLLTNVAINHKG